MLLVACKIIIKVLTLSLIGNLVKIGDGPAAVTGNENCKKATAKHSTFLKTINEPAVFPTFGEDAGRREFS